MPAQAKTVALLWGVRLLTLTATGLSGYLVYAGLQTTEVVGCGFGGFDCEAVLASRWAKWYGVPVAALGLACYGTALLASLAVGTRSTALSGAAWRVLEFAAPTAVGAALWFAGVQLFDLGSFCAYCFATHACGLLMALLIALLRSRSRAGSAPLPAAAALLAQKAPMAAPQPNPSPMPPPSLGLPTFLGLLGVCLLAGGQFLHEAPSIVAGAKVELSDDLGFVGEVAPPEQALTTATATDPPSLADEAEQAGQDPPAAEENRPSQRETPRHARRLGGERILMLLDGQLKLDTYQHPIVGSPDAPNIVVELMDYSCPHCREFHKILSTALHELQGEVAVVVIPVPSELLCNPYVKEPKPINRGACRIAKLALAVAKIDPNAFAEFHHWLLQGESMPNFTAALVEARELVDPRELSRELREEAVAARIQRNVELAGRIAKTNPGFGLPTQIIGDQLWMGPADDLPGLYDLWERVFDFERPAVEIPF